MTGKSSIPLSEFRLQFKSYHELDPTYDVLPQFWEDFRALTSAQREKFLCARDLFRVDLASGGGFRAGLRVKGVRTKPGVFEMTWAIDGRALFAYGESQKESIPHVIWLRVGTHRIFETR